MVRKNLCLLASDPRPELRVLVPTRTAHLLLPLGSYIQSNRSVAGSELAPTMLVAGREGRRGGRGTCPPAPS